ncbi:secretin and TonB N-terminal domain-containing protein [Candidatus Poribacteria bacterium]|nr:secretin and TonB N-terminal domain-containing protein [Candidatus Poribacteria bacterium]
MHERNFRHNFCEALFDTCKGSLGKFGVLLLFSSMACSSLGSEKPINKVDVMLGPLSEPSPVTQEPQLEERPLFKLSEPKAETGIAAAGAGRKFTLTVRDADIRDVLMAFSKEGDYNLIIDPSITGSVSADLKEVDISQALDAILTPLGYSYVREGAFLRITPQPLETRAFSFNYVTTSRKSKRSLSFTSMSVVGQSSGVSVSGGSGGSSSGGGGGGAGQSESSINDIVSASIWSDVQLSLETIVFGNSQGSTSTSDELKAFSRGDEIGRRLIVNPQGGTIYVSAYPWEMKQVESFLRGLEESVRRQVLIEAQILEILLSDDFAYGLNWSYSLELSHLSDLKGNLLDFTGAFNDSAFNQFLAPDEADFQIGLANDHFSVLLNTLARQGQVNVLSSPRISTMNNQPAVIRVIRDEVFFQADVAPTVIVNGVVTGGEVEFNPVILPIGIVLEVTPQVGDDNTVSLDIHPSISSIVRVEASPRGDTQPVVDRREMDTVVKVRNSDTLVLAGLIQESHQESNKEVPLAGRIPVLGNLLFKGTDHNNAKTELVIMLRPTILDDFKITRIYNESMDRISRAKKEPAMNLNPYVYGKGGEE